nr:hypothetical protein CJLB15_00073 [Campylobacter phage CJLB-15]
MGANQKFKGIIDEIKKVINIMMMILKRYY